MKTIKKGMVILILLLFLTLTACTSGAKQTKVKVVSLTYETQGQQLRANNIFKLNASKPINYIFPGDELAFTVEIEDPDFEFISLLSLKLNDQMIRANTTDAITSTRDCGLNICVDFPYPVSSGVTTYSLTELKFATLGSDDPIDALIENDAVSVSIEIWEDSVSPYILDAVNLLNEVYSSLTFYENPMIFETNEEANEFYVVDENSVGSRVLIILDFEGSIVINETIYKNGKSENDLSEDDYFWVYYGLNEDGTYTGGTGRGQAVSVNIGGFDMNEAGVVEYPSIGFGFFSLDLKDVYFSNIGNTIYVNFGDISVPLITLSNRTQIVRFSEEYITPHEEFE